MAKKNTRNTKSRIVSAAWKLFYENGYDDTTVEEIVEESGTSKGSFYHYFSGKDALLSSLSDLFDDKYQELIPTLDPEVDSFEQLMVELPVVRAIVPGLELTADFDAHSRPSVRLFHRYLEKAGSFERE